jgi:uncharacterized repeat protein (TIGR03803 family)
MLRLKGLSLFVITANLVFALFSTSPALASTERVLWSFGAAGDGSAPTGNLIPDASGNLYGVTLLGGTNNTGTVYELSPDGQGGWTESVLYSFGPSGSGDGVQPEGGVVMDHSGNLYGTTFVGGTNNFGTVFELSPQAGGGWAETVLYSFGQFPDGRFPTDSPVLDADGNLYGTSSGALFELSPGSTGWTETILHAMPVTTEPNIGLIWRRVGVSLYGSVGSGGGIGLGGIYRLRREGTNWVETGLHSFNHTDGNPQTGGTLVEDQNLNLFGASNGGCANGTGGVWELIHNAGQPGTYQLLYSFGAEGSGDGNYPQSGVILAPNGTLYGTTGFGGANSDAGTVFSLASTQSGWQETILYTFTGGKDGGAPVGQLLRDNQGRLYGVTLRGGKFGGGALFRVTP